MLLNEIEWDLMNIFFCLCEGGLSTFPEIERTHEECYYLLE